MIAFLLGAALSAPASAVEVITLDSKAPLVQARVMIRAGSAQDPPGKEGLAALAARLLVEGSSGDPKDPLTKEKLADITRPWGSGAMPGVSVSKELIVLSFQAPREAFGEYVDRVLAPLLTRPLFDAKELDRVRAESLQELRSSLRLEQIEMLGLTALDNDIHTGTAYAAPTLGTEKGLAAIGREDLLRFYRDFIDKKHVVGGLSASDSAMKAKMERVLDGLAEGAASPADKPVAAPPEIKGREALIVTMPNAIATGIHAGFPLSITRRDPDYWPLYVANVWFGTHRDSFSHLYQVIREQRGYNYGDYSYVEHFESRPGALFPSPNYPRARQYFSIWVRPVAHEYAPHIVKAITWELENFIRSGLTEEQCALAKNKAKVLYLNLAETADRMLGSRLDDAFYGLKEPYLGGYLRKIDGVGCADMNAALRRHLQAENLKYVIVTRRDKAEELKKALTSDGPMWGKKPEDYQIETKEQDGQKIYMVPETKLELLRRESAWAYESLKLAPGRVRIVSSDDMFETADLPAER